ncbi:MAG: class I SAM-dependent methyltransferase, partial [Halobacteria archaeon]
MSKLKSYTSKYANKEVKVRDIFSRIWNRQFLAWKLSRFLNDKNISRYIKEAKEDRLINSRLLEKTGYSWRDIDPLGIVVYAVVRSLKPKIVVETGVQSGISSLYILQALKKNNYGFLYSIDLPDRDLERVGEAVPDHMRDSWHLIIGNSKELLPKLLEKLMSIDIFLHDSLHTYEHMFFEFECALKYLGENGLIV